MTTITTNGRTNAPIAELVSAADESLNSSDQPARNDAWRGFEGSAWRTSIDARDFLQNNYTPYEGDSAFLAGATIRTIGVWAKLTALFGLERERGVLDVDNVTPSTITAHAPGYIDQDAELIVGLQTDAPLKRAIMPNGGWRVVETGLKTYGYSIDPQVKRSLPSTEDS